MEALIHYTLNTGHRQESPRSKVADDVIAKLQPLLEPGTHALASLLPQYAGYELRVPQTPAGYVATVMYGSTVPLVTLAVADTEEAAAIWPEIERLYLSLTDRAMARADFAAPRQPASPPWLAVVILSARAGVAWLSDLERRLAWAWLESRT